MESGFFHHVLNVFRDAYNCLRYRIILLFLIMVLSGILEGMGLVLLFPLLGRFGIGEVSGNFLVDYVMKLFDVIALPDSLGALLAFVVLVFLLQVAATYSRAWYQARCQTAYTEHWHKNLFHAFMQSSWMYLQSDEMSRRVTAIMSESGRISAALNMLLQMLNSLLLVIVYSLISLSASWQVVVMLISVGLFLYLSTRPLSERSRNIGQKVTRVSEGLQKSTQEFLYNAKLVKATASEHAAIEKFDDAAANFRAVYRKANVQPALIVAIYMSCGYIMLGAGIWMGVSVFSVNPAAILVAIYVFLRLYVQISNMQQYRESFALSYQALPNARRQYEEACRHTEEQSGIGLSLQGDKPVSLEIRDLAVSYGDVEALKGVSFNIPGGSVIGITGASGSGKSTLLDSIIGLIRANSGSIIIDDKHLQEYNPHEWRRAIGYVSQETLLLNDSVEMNIAWGSDESDREDVIDAAKLANAHDFISALEAGYRTRLGENGVRLSGGQKQRIGLARALMRGRKLLLLDEATSALDSESETEVMQALEQLRGKITVVIAAHRLSTLKNADQILILDDGRIIEQGSWESLIKNKGKFQSLWELQHSAPVPDPVLVKKNNV